MEKLTDFLFIAQVMILAAILIRWSARRRVPGVAGLGLIGWLAVTGSLAIKGFFGEWSRLPPRLMPALLVPVIGGLLFLSYSRQTRALLASTPLQWPIYLQSFRILMEIILWLLYVQHRAPAIMTFEGAGAGEPSRSVAINIVSSLPSSGAGPTNSTRTRASPLL